MAAAHASESSSSRVTLVCSNRPTAASGRRPLTWTAPSACLDEYACAEWGAAVGYVGWHMKRIYRSQHKRACARASHESSNGAFV